MSVNELIEKLSALSAEERKFPAYVHDGMDPSDPCEATTVKVAKPSWDRVDAVEILSY